MTAPVAEDAMFPAYNSAAYGTFTAYNNDANESGMYTTGNGNRKTSNNGYATTSAPVYEDDDEDAPDDDEDPTALPPTPPHPSTVDMRRVYGGGRPATSSAATSSAAASAVADADAVAADEDVGPDMDAGTTTTTAPPTSSSLAGRAHLPYKPPAYSPVVPPYHAPGHSSSLASPPVLAKPGMNHRLPLTYNKHRQVAEAYDNGSGGRQSLTPEQMRVLQDLLQQQQNGNGGGAVSAASSSSRKQPSYWSRAWAKRRDIVKLIMLACVIIFALAVNSAILHYITVFVEESGDKVSSGAEAAMRFGYPVAIVLVIWIIKMYASPPASATAVSSS